MVVLIAFALVGLSARATGAVVGGGPATAESRPRVALSPVAGTAVAGLCLLATAAIVGYGLWIIIS